MLLTFVALCLHPTLLTRVPLSFLWLSGPTGPFVDLSIHRVSSARRSRRCYLAGGVDVHSHHIPYRESSYARFQLDRYVALHLLIVTKRVCAHIVFDLQSTTPALSFSTALLVDGLTPPMPMIIGLHTRMAPFTLPTNSCVFILYVACQLLDVELL